MSNFKVGEKVVCVEPIDHLVKNQIYTVKSILQKNGEVGILVEELEPIPTGILKGYYFYNVNRFRKLDHQFSEDVIAEIIKQVKEESLTLAN